MTGNKQPGIVVQDRDRQLLRELAIMRVIDREQAKRVAGFRSTTRANCRLLALSRAGLLRRFFLGTVGGARKALYALSSKGADLVGVQHRGPRRRRDETLVADFSVFHQLRVNEVYGIAKHAPIPHGRFIRWETFFEPLQTGLPLVPDGYFEVGTQERGLCSFLEVDLGHESRSVWRNKVQSYLRYAASGDFGARFGQHQFRVLVIGDSVRRIDSLRAATGAITEKIFWFTTFEAVSNAGFWSSVWQRPKGEKNLSLIEVS